MSDVALMDPAVCAVAVVADHRGERMTETTAAVTAEQMREVDRAMIEDFHIELVQMMENAGRGLAELAVEQFRPRRVLVLAGPGGNGGGGLVAARHLSNRGVQVGVVLAALPDRLGAVPRHQLDILTRMDVPAAPALGVDLEPALRAHGDVDLVIDALLGYSLAGDPREPFATLIRWVNAQPTPVLSLDTPSGLDVTSGVPAEPCVLATATLTLALPKTGLLHSHQVGRLYLADISVPPALYRRMGIEVGDLFAERPIVQVATR
jgi:NAD(P)H-hydrate epimerase